MPMRPDERDTEEPDTPAEPCVRCGHVSQAAVWGHPVCFPCYRDWQEAAPKFGARECLEVDTAAAYRAFTDAWAVPVAKAVGG